MKVKELIEILRTLPEDLDVVTQISRWEIGDVNIVRTGKFYSSKKDFKAISYKNDKKKEIDAVSLISTPTDSKE